jgi:hypothetical protein
MWTRGTPLMRRRINPWPSIGCPQSIFASRLSSTNRGGSLQSRRTSADRCKAVVLSSETRVRPGGLRKKPGHVFPAVADGVHQEACGLSVPLLLIRHITRTQGRYPGPTPEAADSTPTSISTKTAKTVTPRRGCPVRGRHISAQTAEDLTGRTVASMRHAALLMGIPARGMGSGKASDHSNG